MSLPTLEQKHTYTNNLRPFPAKMTSTGSKTPTNFIHFHTNYDYKGRVLITRPTIFFRTIMKKNGFSQSLTWYAECLFLSHCKTTLDKRAQKLEETN